MNCFLIAAVTADGFIARNPDDRSFDWTSLEDKKFYVDMIKQAGTVVMGRQTFGTFTRYPKGLQFVIYTREPASFQNPKPEVIDAWATQQTPAELLADLAKKGCTDVAVCGGSSIYTMFMKSRLVTKLYLTVEPVLFGQGVSLFSDSLDQNLQLVEVKKLSDQTIVLEYDVLKSV